MSADIQTASPPVAKLRIAVIILAVMHTLGSLSSLSVFGNLSEYVNNGFSQWLLLAGLPIFPVLAVASLYFAIKGDVRRAIMAIAAIILVAFVTDYLPSMFIHGLELHGGAATSLQLLAQTIVFPLLAVVAFVLARRDEKLVLATVLASLAMVANILSVVAFAVAVAIYGF